MSINDRLNRLEQLFGEHVINVNPIDQFNWLKAYVSGDDEEAERLALSIADPSCAPASLESMHWLREFLPEPIG